MGAGQTTPSELFSSSGTGDTVCRPSPLACAPVSRSPPVQPSPGWLPAAKRGRRHRGQLLRGPFAPPRPAAQVRFHPPPATFRGGGRRTAPARTAAPRPGRISPPPGSWARGAPELTAPTPPKPKPALQGSRLRPQERRQNSAIPPPQLIFRWRQRLCILPHVDGF